MAVGVSVLVWQPSASQAQMLLLVGSYYQALGDGVAVIPGTTHWGS